MEKPKRPTEIGPTGRRVAANLAAIRSDRGISQGDLAARVEQLGRPMSGPIISKTEKLDRRIDVDDLAAFALALGTTPNRLLLASWPNSTRDIDLAPAVRVPTADAWDWATGSVLLWAALLPWLMPGEEDEAEAEARRFSQENNPRGFHMDMQTRMEIEEMEKHPDLMKQAVELVRSAIRQGVSLWTLHCAIELAPFIIETSGGETQNSSETERHGSAPGMHGKAD